MNFLAVDLGGTKTLLAVFQSNFQLSKLNQKRYISSEWSSLEQIIEDYIEKLPKEIERPSVGCIAVAGPVNNGSSKITNLGWELNERQLLKFTGFKNIELINDFNVLIYGIPFLKSEQQKIIQAPKGEIPSEGVIAIIGAGTGLGISRGLKTSTGIIALPSEGGHREFSPRNKREWEITKWIKDDLQIDRLSIERIVSGNGLGHIVHWRLNQDDAKFHPMKELANAWRNSSANKYDLPALASKSAKDGDPILKEALQIWLSAYGSAAGDLALQELCQAGLWIGGGTAKKHLEGLRSNTFLDAMKNKGRFQQFLQKIPVMALIDEEIGLFSAACRARMLN